ncbi:EI24 domain-containing protein [Psychroserpens sp.]|uniref:EI24 domain-containing protein n=1 Tax=Psychroserpens sp. TaxID=2020870 RepID=UPI001B2D57F3|nr:EI24 domain-containing protein [Psychroserpens sp.]MBO6605463.1 EI24 domain-containing protein [Psychroserpens sp.]MBO6630383.1 EI24 domain-containing protein [Psychroserpens sp.]MBO6653728.1 EI24 domain-containing protein [Psychroserpens sp.]MBO6682049.1 EI24 domain-containing protein [Psychroserpens sp.]MBO6748837.1 EI24 domain-containing protein [Psychroserpens sp.]
MIRHIISGMEAYSGTLNLISKLKLWKYFFIPIAISIITATLIFVAAYGFSDNIGRFIAQIWIWDWGKETFTSISTFIGAIVVLALGIIVYKHIILALSAPFMSPVSEKIEAHLTGVPRILANKTSFQEQLWRGIRINMRNLVKELLVSIPILLLKFIPVVNIFSFALLFLVQAYYAGFGNMDYTLERHFKYRDSVRFVGRYRGIAIGNGIIFILFTLIPILGWVLVLPFSVTAATTSTVKLLQTEQKIGGSNIQVI